MPITIVYFANLFINPIHGQDLIQAQLTDLAQTGLPTLATLHIVLSVPMEEDLRDLRSTITRLFLGRASLHWVRESCHEYPGIRLAHQLARSDPSPQHYLLYFHSKSISRFKGKRERIERALHTTVIAPWKKVLNIFHDHPSIDKVGSTCSGMGWVWWNYWWVRASYLAQVETPLKTPRRHYYEDWICRRLAHPTTHPTDPLRPEDSLTDPIYQLSNQNGWGLSHRVSPIGQGCSATQALLALLSSRTTPQHTTPQHTTPQRTTPQHTTPQRLPSVLTRRA
jgi:hypothetical protein